MNCESTDKWAICRGQDADLFARLQAAISAGGPVAQLKDKLTFRS